eukprot:g39127.t1
MDSPAAELDQLTQRLPPLDLRGLTHDLDSVSARIRTPCVGNLDTPLAPRALERPVTGHQAPSEGEPRTGEGGRLGWPEERDSDVAAACDNQQSQPQAQACREERQTRLQAGKGRGSWTDLRGPLSAQWIRHKHEFRNTRPWALFLGQILIRNQVQAHALFPTSDSCHQD